MPVRVSVPARGLAALGLCAEGLPPALREGVRAAYSSAALRVAARDVQRALGLVRALGPALGRVELGGRRLPAVGAAGAGEAGSANNAGEEGNGGVREQRDILLNAEELLRAAGAKGPGEAETGSQGAAESRSDAESRPAAPPQAGGLGDALDSAPDSAPADSLDSPDPYPALLRAFQLTPLPAALRDAGIPYSLVPAQRTLGYRDLPRRTMLEHLLAGAARELGLPPPAPPAAFETVGHIAHYNLRAEHAPFRYLIGAVTLDTEGPIRTVVSKPEAVSGTFRVCPLELIAGAPDYVAEVRQGGLRFRLDFSAVYWNSRLAEEHERVCASVAARVREAAGPRAEPWVLDLTGGVGPFAVSLAASHGLRRVLCNDLNPEAYRWMRENVRLNGCKEHVECRNADARALLAELLPSWDVGAVLLNLPELSLEFLRPVGDILRGMEASGGVGGRGPASALGSASGFAVASAPAPSPPSQPWFYLECFTSEANAEEDVLLRALRELYPRLAARAAGADPVAYSPEVCARVREAARLAFSGTQRVTRGRLVSPSRWYCCLEFRLLWRPEGELLGEFTGEEGPAPGSADGAAETAGVAETASTGGQQPARGPEKAPRKEPGPEEAEESRRRKL